MSNKLSPKDQVAILRSAFRNRYLMTKRTDLYDTTEMNLLQMALNASIASFVSAPEGEEVQYVKMWIPLFNKEHMERYEEIARELYPCIGLDYDKESKC